MLNWQLELDQKASWIFAKLRIHLSNQQEDYPEKFSIGSLVIRNASSHRKFKWISIRTYNLAPGTEYTSTVRAFSATSTPFKAFSGKANGVVRVTAPRRL